MDKALEYAARIAYSSKEVLNFSYESAKKVRGYPGCVVECGIGAGGNLIALMAGAPNKPIFAFDSFQGLPRPSNRDNQMPGIRMLSKEEQESLPNPGEQVLESTGAVAVSVEDVMNHIWKAGLNPLHNLYLVEGWFEETIPTFNYLEGICLLRLDGDLYNSTLVCLKYLYPKCIRGSIIIIDDWALPGCRNAVIDYFDIEDFPRMEFINGKDSTVAHWVK